jgi:hypothetical protein
LPAACCLLPAACCLTQMAHPVLISSLAMFDPRRRATR